MTRRAALLAALLAGGCTDGGERALEPAPCALPAIARSSLTGSATNVLSVLVAAEVRHADSVMVRYQGGDTPDGVTPALAVRDDAVEVPVLGLAPSTAYGVQLVAVNGCGSTSGAVLSYTTRALPPDLPTYTAEGSDPAPGFVVLAAGRYGLVIDNAGRVVWYHRFPDGPGLNFQAQPNGRYAARPPASADGAWVEVAIDGRTTRTLGCAGGLPARMHDLLAESDGSYWLLCDEVRTLDLSTQGASRQARVLGTGVQRRAATGEVRFAWSPFDHLAVELAVLDSADRAAAVVNWTHGNALDLDGDGQLLLSFRNLSEVTKIDTRTGAVVWRLGGRHDQFAYENADPPPFLRQHGVRAIGGGRLLLLDNLGDARASHAERYEVDGVRRTARLHDAYGAAAGLVAQVGGTVQALPDGHTLVSFGSGAGVEEYDAAGRVVWRLTGHTGYVFRAQRIRSLYRPGVGDPR